ncbi:tetraacyldisaccharide 4'-kinase [Acidobacteriota bacterium]
MKQLLAPIEWLLKKVAKTRVSLYERGIFRASSAEVLVISVGNITVGGTGKTPLVEQIARFLKESNHRPAILSRGYRGKYSERIHVVSDTRKLHSNWELAGDEPYLLAKRLPGIPVIVSKNRFLAGEFAHKMLGADALILDDGYQHLRLKRDLNILIVDCTNPFGGGHMPPLGRLREPLDAIRRADMVMLNRHDHPHDEIIIRKTIKKYHPEVRIFHCTNRPVKFRLFGRPEQFDISEFQGVKAALFCGIGNPGPFRSDIDRLGVEIVLCFNYRDHHRYSEKEIRWMTKEALKKGAEFLVTTEKDAVRLPPVEGNDLSIIVLEAEAIVQEEGRFRSCLLEPAGRMLNTHL